MIANVQRRLIMPALIPIGVFVVAAAIIITVGETLISLFDANASSELARVELWFALILAVVILGACAFVATRPQGSMGPLDREVVIGTRPFFAPIPPRAIVPDARRGGPVGTLSDIREGDTLFARSGPLARVIGVLPGDQEYGRRRRGYLWAEGLYGASDELWIPVEAVLNVYPETRSVFLAIKGDETEHFGWNRPPESFRRDPQTIHIPKA